MCLVQLIADFGVFLICFTAQFHGKVSFVEEGGKRDEVVIVRPRSSCMTSGLLPKTSILLCLGSILLYLGWLLHYLRRLLLLGSGVEWLVALKVFFKFSLSSGRDNIVRSNNCLGAGYFLITELGRQFEVFVVVWLFFDSDHGLFSLMNGCDHGRLDDFLRLRLGSWFSYASLTALSNFLIGDQSLITDVHGLLITPRSLFAFDLFIFLALVVGDSQRFFIADLHFGRVITALRKSVDHFLHGVVLKLPPGYVCVHVLH